VNYFSQVGDEILEINHQSTRGMSHAEAIDLIQSGGSLVNLLVRRTGTLPPNISGIIMSHYFTKSIGYSDG